MTFVSYAQNFEDVILWRALKHVPNGTYVDIGAQDPVVDSVSYGFYLRGWRGTHAEAAPDYAQRLRQARPDETVIEALVAGPDSPTVFHHFADTGLSTGDPEIAKAHRDDGRTSVTRDVSKVSLAEILDRYGDRSIHWLKIDVEGMEAEVLRTWTPSPMRPWVVVIESTQPLTSIAVYTVWEPLLTSMGYEFAYFDGLNRFYVHETRTQLKKAFGPGPNYFDDFALSPDANSPFCSGFRDKLFSTNADLSARGNELAIFHVANEALRTEISLRDGELARAERDLALALAEKESVRARFDESQAQLDREHALSLARLQLIESTRRSVSWRITAPLRFVARLPRGAIRALKSSARFVARCARPPMAWLANDPRARAFGRRIARYVPSSLAMTVRRAFLGARKPPPPVTAPPQSTDELSPKAKLIFAQLSGDGGA